MSIYGILPERLLAVGASVLLVLPVNSPKAAVLPQLSAGLLAGVLALVVSPILIGGLTDTVLLTSGLNGLTYDGLSQSLKALRVLATISCLLVVGPSSRGGRYHSQYAILRLFALLGGRLRVSSEDLMVFYLALELQSLSLYVLAASIRGSAYSTEAGLKYFRLGAFASGLLLLGASLVYGSLGTTEYAGIGLLLTAEPGVEGSLLFETWAAVGLGLIVVALRFKLAAVPFHRWSPDVIEGSPATSSRFFATVTKIAAFGALARIAYGPFYGLWSEPYFGLLGCVAIRSALSRVLAALAAIGQRRRKRFLAYSGIGHRGFILMGLSSGTLEGLQASLVYLCIYVIGSLGTWAAVGLTKITYFSDLPSPQRNPAWAVVFAVAMFSMAGIPPMAGFFAKLSVFFAAREGSNYALATVAVLASVVGAFYYLRLIKIRYFDRGRDTVGSTTLNDAKVSNGVSNGVIGLGLASWVMALSTFVTLSRLLSPGLIVALAKFGTEFSY